MQYLPLAATLPYSQDAASLFSLFPGKAAAPLDIGPLEAKQQTSKRVDEAALADVCINQRINEQLAFGLCTETVWTLCPRILSHHLRMIALFLVLLHVRGTKVPSAMYLAVLCSELQNP
jgi:hypothetical protein